MIWPWNRKRKKIIEQVTEALIQVPKSYELSAYSTYGHVVNGGGGASNNIYCSGYMDLNPSIHGIVSKGGTVLHSFDEKADGKNKTNKT